MLRLTELLYLRQMDSQGVQRKNVYCWKRLPSNGCQQVSADTSVYSIQCVTGCYHSELRL
jgi:hypothetical protein